MGCKLCKPSISGVCKVCEALDDDSTVKNVTYCGTCGVYICSDCNTDLVRRIKAFVKVKL